MEKKEGGSCGVGPRDKNPSPCFNETMTERLPSNIIPWILLAVSAATLGGALFFEHVLGYMPCSLCLEGRWPHYLALGPALIAGLLSRNTNLGIFVLTFIMICALLYLWGAGSRPIMWASNMAGGKGRMPVAAPRLPPRFRNCRQPLKVA